MKTLGFLLASIGLATSATQAQTLQGAYYTVEKERGFSSNLFLFAGNHFFYQHSGCLGIRTGEGNFKLKGKQLLLVFRKAAADTIRRVKLTAYAPGSSPLVLVRVTNERGILLAGATVKSTLTLNAAATTDSIGTASLRYAPPAHDKLLVATVGYDPVHIQLLPTVNQRVTVRLGPPYYFEKGDTLIFQLKSNFRNALVLREIPDLEYMTNTSISYEHCERIPAEEAKKQLAQTQ